MAKKAPAPVATAAQAGVSEPPKEIEPAFPMPESPKAEEPVNPYPPPMPPVTPDEPPRKRRYRVQLPGHPARVVTAWNEAEAERLYAQGDGTGEYPQGMGIIRTELAYTVEPLE